MLSAPQQINFTIHGKTALAEIQGNEAFVYVCHKKITLKINNQDQNSLSKVEEYLNKNKEKILNLLRQHDLIENVCRDHKTTTLLDGGRFQYYSDKDSKQKSTTVEKEYERLQKKIQGGTEGPKLKWKEKLTLVKRVMEEIKFCTGLKPAVFKPETQKSFDQPATLRSSLAKLEPDLKYSWKPLTAKDMRFAYDAEMSGEVNEDHIRAVRKKTKKRMSNLVYGLGKPMTAFSLKRHLKK